jgi:WXG100 family type VII secretion target
MTTPVYGADGSITYNHGAIMSVSESIGTFAGAMDGAIEDLFRYLQHLFAADWNGQAGTACQNAHTQVLNAASDIKTQLFNVGVTLGAVGDNMSSLDNRIAAAMEQGH